MINKFIAFDIEMPSQHMSRISAIGITVVCDGEITEKLYYLVNPETPFDPYVIDLVGITPEMVENEPAFPEIWEKIKDIMSDGVLVAHGAPGDMKTLCGCLKSYGIEWKDKAQYICTCRVGLEVYKEYEHYSLDYMCDTLGFPLKHHHALSDSEGCAMLMLHYINKGVDTDSFIQEFDVVKCRNANKKKAPRKKRNFTDKVISHLQKMKSKAYREAFISTHPHLDPETVIGVKEGALRQYAESLIKTNRAPDYISSPEHKYYEENNLHAIIVSKTKKLSAAFKRIDEFLPYVNDTATCRLLVPYIFKKRQFELTEKIGHWLSSDEVYTQFFALEAIEKYFIRKEYLTLWADKIAGIEASEPFLERKKAVVFSKALVLCTDTAAKIFIENKLGVTTHNKAVELALNNDSITQEKKELIQNLIR